MRSNDRAESLNIRDNAFFIDANLSTTPQGVMLRELFQNALEAMRDPKEKRRLIRLYASTAGKLVMINSGVGISEDDLIVCTDFSKSVGKRMGLKGRENRGEGAKIAGLHFNPLGIRYRSRKNTGTDDEQFSEALLHYDDDLGWSRKLEEVEVGGDIKMLGAYPVMDDEITAEEAERYAAFDSDFTEVVLMGAKVDQRTAYDPYGNGKEGEKQAVPNELFARYYDYPKLGIPIVVQAHGPSFRDGADFRPIVPVGQLIAANADAFDNYKDRFVKLPSGVKLEFVKTKAADKNRTPWNTKSMGRNGGRAALVWRGEMYDVLEDDRANHYKAWSRAAPSFGLTGLAAELSLFIHIPDEWDITDGRYRDALMLNGKKISVRDFEGVVVSNRPEWVKALLNTSRSNSASMKDVYDDLRRFAAKLSVKLDSQGPNFTIVHGGAGNGNQGGKPSGTKTQDTDRQQGEGDGANTGGAAGSGSGTRSATQGTRRARAKNGAGEHTRSTVPMPTWYDDAEANPDLVGRGADFRMSTADLFLNREYPARQQMIDAVFNDYIRVKNPGVALTDTINHMIADRVEIAIARAVGRAVLIALHKRGTKGWSPTAVEAAMSGESLSVVFEMVMDDLGAVAQSLQMQETFKGALAEAGATAAAA